MSAHQRRMALFLTVFVTLSVVSLSLADVEGWRMGKMLSGPPQHVLAFSVLGILASFAFPRRGLMVWGSLTILGIAIELVQPSVGRAFEWIDVIMNSLGALIGPCVTALVTPALRALNRRRLHPR